MEVSGQRIIEAIKAIGRGVLVKPKNFASFIQSARQLGYSDVANWVETHKEEFFVRLVGLGVVTGANDNEEIEEEQKVSTQTPKVSRITLERRRRQHGGERGSG